MKTLENYIQQKLSYAAKNPEYAETMCDQAFGAVEMFIIQNPRKEVKVTDLWQDIRPKFEKIMRGL